MTIANQLAIDTDTKTATLTNTTHLTADVSSVVFAIENAPEQAGQPGRDSYQNLGFGDLTQPLVVEVAGEAIAVEEQIEQELISREAGIELSEEAIENSYNIIAMLQDQGEEITNTFMEQASWVPQEGRQAFMEWSRMYKKGRADFKRAVNDGYKKVEGFFTAAVKS